MSGKVTPAKPWERKGTAGSSTATPLGPSTAHDGAAKPWEQAGGATTGPELSTVTSRSRPWESNASTSGYGASPIYGGANSYGAGPNSYNAYGGGSVYGGGSAYGSSYGAGGYGNSYGGYGGSSMYGRPYGSSTFGTSYGGGYGSPGMNRGGYGGMGGYGMGGLGSTYGMGGYGSGMSGYGGIGGMEGYGGSSFGGPPLAGPDGMPPQPPTAWQHMLHAIGGVVHFFGRLSFLVDENAHAFHFFISSLLQLLDRAGSLYGELARFVLRLLGYKDKSKELALQPLRPGEGPPAAGQQRPHHSLPGLPAPSIGGGANFDSIWKSN